MAPAHDTGRNRGQNSGSTNSLGEHERAIGRNHRESDLNHGFVKPLDDHRNDPTNAKPDNKATTRYDHKLAGHGNGTALRTEDVGHYQREQDNSGPVVEQAFSLNQRCQSWRRTKVAKYGSDCNRIGCCNDCSEGYSQLPVEDLSHAKDPSGKDNNGSGDASAQKDARDCERENATPYPPKCRKIEMKRGLEQQSRQEKCK